MYNWEGRPGSLGVAKPKNVRFWEMPPSICQTDYFFLKFSIPRCLCLAVYKTHLINAARQNQARVEGNGAEKHPVKLEEKKKAWTSEYVMGTKVYEAG